MALTRLGRATAAGGSALAACRHLCHQFLAWFRPNGFVPTLTQPPSRASDVIGPRCRARGVYGQEMGLGRDDRHQLRLPIRHVARKRPGLSQSNTPEVPPAPLEQAVA